ncbi:MAG TPA: DUF177 domain-containing protein [Anaeromyxobacteraceae bacterium]|jgi:uncharacterized protein
MRVNIEEIKEEGGLDRAWDLTREQLDEMVRGDSAGYRARAPAHVEAHLERVSRRVLLSARSRAALGAPCGRCLAPTDVAVPVEFQITLVPAKEAPEPEARGEDRPRSRAVASFRPEAADEESYAGREIDLDPIVREQILLALPGYPLCREGCKGLCPVCGQDRNERECGCQRREPDPRWAGLEKYRERK